MKKIALICFALLLVGVVQAQVSVTRVDKGVPVKFESLVRAGTSLEWVFPGGVVKSGTEVSHIFSEAGIFDITLRATDSLGRSKEATKQVMVRSFAPTADVFASPPSGDKETDFFFSAEGRDPERESLTYVWTFPDGTELEGPTVSHRFSETGNQKVVLSVSDADNLVKKDITVLVLETLKAVNKAPRVKIRGVFPQNAGTVDTRFIFFSEGRDPDLDTLTYEWTMGDGRRMFVANPGYQYAKPGVYQVELKVSDGELTVTDSVQVNVFETIEEVPFPTREEEILVKEIEQERLLIEENSGLTPLSIPEIVSPGGGLTSAQKVEDLIQNTLQNEEGLETKSLTLELLPSFEAAVEVETRLVEIEKEKIKLKKELDATSNEEERLILAQKIKTLEVESQVLNVQAEKSREVLAIELSDSGETGVPTSLDKSISQAAAEVFLAEAQQEQIELEEALEKEENLDKKIELTQALGAISEQIEVLDLVAQGSSDKALAILLKDQDEVLLSQKVLSGDLEAQEVLPLLSAQKQILERELARTSDEEARNVLKKRIKKVDRFIASTRAAGSHDFGQQQLHQKVLIEALEDKIKVTKDPVFKSFLEAELRILQTKQSASVTHCAAARPDQGVGFRANLKARLLFDYGIFLSSEKERLKEAFKEEKSEQAYEVLTKESQKVESDWENYQIFIAPESDFVLETGLSELDQLRAERNHLLIEFTEAQIKALEKNRREMEAQLLEKSRSGQIETIKKKIVSIDLFIQEFENLKLSKFTSNVVLLDKITKGKLRQLQTDRSALVQKVASAQGTVKIIAKAQLAHTQEVIIDQERFAAVVHRIEEIQSEKPNLKPQKTWSESDVLQQYGRYMTQRVTDSEVDKRKALEVIEDLGCVLPPKLNLDISLEEAFRLLDQARTNILKFNADFRGGFEIFETTLIDLAQDKQSLTRFMGSEFTASDKISEVRERLRALQKIKEEALKDTADTQEQQEIAVAIEALSAQSGLVSQLFSRYEVPESSSLGAAQDVVVAGSDAATLKIWKSIYNKPRSSRTLAQQRARMAQQRAQIEQKIENFTPAQKGLARKLLVQLEQDLIQLDQIEYDLAHRSQFVLIHDFVVPRAQIEDEASRTALDYKIQDMIDHFQFYQSLLADMEGRVQTEFFVYGSSHEDDLSGRAFFFDWDLGDGNRVFGQNPHFRYVYPGFYRVELEVTDGLTSRTNSLTIKVEASQ